MFLLMELNSSSDLYSWDPNWKPKEIYSTFEKAFGAKLKYGGDGEGSLFWKIVEIPFKE